MLNSWGSGEHGALGHGKISESLLPRAVKSAPLTGKQICETAGGDSHSLAVDTQGNVYAWGRNREGQLGHGERSNEPCCEPRRVEGLAHERVVKAAAGTGHTLCLTKKGEVYTFGAHYERIKDASAQFFSTGRRELSEYKKRMIEKSHLSYFSGNSDSFVPLEEMPSDTEPEEGAGEAGPGRATQVKIADTAFKRVIHASPWLVQVGQRLRVAEIAAGHCFSAVVTEDGRLYTWGYNDKGQLGLGDRISREQPTLVRRMHSRSTEVENVPSMKSVSCGEQHVISLDRSAACWSWGLGVFGQLGVGDCADRLRPARVESLELADGCIVPVDIAQVACGMYHSVFLCKGGKIYLCGHREYGQQGESFDFSESGTGRAQSVVRPKELGLADAFEAISFAQRGEAGGEGSAEQESTAPVIVKIASGSLHSVALTADGDVITWGWGGTGSLGHGWGEALGRKFAAAPARVVQALKGETCVSIAAGRRHTLAVVDGSSALGALQRDLQSLVETPRWADVTFMLKDGATQDANRTIVAARSPLLASVMAFSTQRFSGRRPLSGATLRVDLTWVSRAAFVHVLAFLYSDECEAPPNLCAEVARAARRLGLPRLVAQCKRILQLSPQQSSQGQRGRASGASSAQQQALQTPIVIPAGTLSADLKELHDGGTPWGTDLEIRPHGHPEMAPILAHKVALASRCPYFDTALCSDFLEGREGVFCLDIEDDDDEEKDEIIQLLTAEGLDPASAPALKWKAINTVVEFLYTAKIPANAGGLSFYAAALREADRLMVTEMVEALEEVLENLAEDAKPAQRQALCSIANGHCAVRLASSLQVQEKESPAAGARTD